MNIIEKSMVAQGLTQAELARKMGTTEAAVSRHIHGKRKVSAIMAVKYEKALGIPKVVLCPDVFKET